MQSERAELGFALFPVAEHAQLSRIMAQLLVEVEHVTMRIPLAEDRNEPKDVGPEPEPWQYAAINPSPASFDAPYSDVWNGKRSVLAGVG